MPQLMERNLSGLLNETFLVYGNHLKEFLLLAFVVQLPLSIINWAAGDGVAGYVVSTILAIFIGALAYGAGIYAVGQQYVTNRVDIVRCYRRVQWRLVS
ncbi:MAG: hypothetical protein FJ317_09295, partial [SAR202 cluster bacterium]|nr:hypothetical protein [SAR202 cluster bacterium]